MDDDAPDLSVSGIARNEVSQGKLVTKIMTLINSLEDVTRTAAGMSFLSHHPDEEKIFVADATTIKLSGS